MVRASVVHAIDGQNCTNGLCWTGRGVGQAHPAADRLHESRRCGPDLGFVLDVGQVDRGEPHRGGADPHGRCADVALPEVAGVDDPAVLDLDVRPQLVGLAEPVGRSERLEVFELVRRRLVVVGDAKSRTGASTGP